MYGVAVTKGAYLWEIALTVADEQAGLATATITDNNNLLGKGGRVCDVSRCRLAARRRAHSGADGTLAGTSALLTSDLLVGIKVRVTVGMR